MPASPEAFWKAPAVARLILQARAGEHWEVIGLAFYPHARNRQRASRAAVDIFRRYASDDDRKVRRLALRRRNWNQNPGLSERTERRRRKRRRDDIGVMRERSDPLVGFGECFT